MPYMKTTTAPTKISLEHWRRDGLARNELRLSSHHRLS